MPRQESLTLFQLVGDEFARLNALIPRLLTSDVNLVAEISNYIVHSGGKRLRPLIVLLGARALTNMRVGDDRVVKLAAIIELLHTATLLHDDVVDQSNLRRGRATANATWGNAPSVLVGDFLYSRAFQLMAELGELRIIQVLADATSTIAQGEVDQLSQIGNTALTDKQYMDVIGAKTAMLFKAAAETAAALCAPAHAEALAKFGFHFGLAYQLIDDALDYEGDSATLGKNVGDDLAEGKMTLPLIYTLNNGSPVERDLVKVAIEARNRSHLNEIIAAVRRCGAIDHVKQRADENARLAARALDEVPHSDAKATLQDLAAQASSRSA